MGIFSTSCPPSGPPHFQPSICPSLFWLVPGTAWMRLCVFASPRKNLTLMSTSKHVKRFRRFPSFAFCFSPCQFVKMPPPLYFHLPPVLRSPLLVVEDYWLPTMPLTLLREGPLAFFCSAALWIFCSRVYMLWTCCMSGSPPAFGLGFWS